MTSLIVGQGEIGKAVKSIISQGVNADKVYTFDLYNEKMPVIKNLDILHVCYPYTSNFADMLDSYIKKYKPWHVVIWSTVPIGTTKRFAGAVHSPVEGRHPKLATSIKNMTRWIGANDFDEGEFFASYFKKFLLKTRVVSNSNFTEFLKLRSTAKYGINLVWTDYEAKTAKRLKMDFELLKLFDEDYNRLYHNLDMPWAQRYILDPPDGKIGGHCIVPNAALLDKQYPSELLKMIKDMS